MRKKELKRIAVYNDKSGDLVQEKGNMDVEMTIDAIHNIKNTTQPFSLQVIPIFLLF